MTLRMRAAAVLVAAACAALAGCKILPIETEVPAAERAAIKAAEAATLWTDQALPHFLAEAEPVGTVLSAIASDLDAAGAAHGYRPNAEGAPWTFVVSGTGTVAEKNTQSRAGTMLVTVAGLDAPVTLQIGPVIRGNAIRDSLPFISFTDFENQLDFAEIGKSLNAETLRAIEPAAAAAEPGATVEFIGVASLASRSDKVLVTPVMLKANAP